MIELAITLGTVISLFFVEKFGMAAGGIVVPGYVALQLTKFEQLTGLILISYITYILINLISKVTFLFGRRLMVVSLLIGIIFSICSHHFFIIKAMHNTYDLSAIGWVIPGLIAYYSLKQGFVKTMAMISITSVMVRLLVIIIFMGKTFS